ncbi:MAG: hypothetical protein A3K19_03485 [Lentisphaerae bacterium RIFOXYB12_FULL_65_16]|nr:MAG: hypothetical protein A3J79_11095 [Elusimicrobia bacterium RIFOXYB2_FULL_62_6]OGV74409.1 MAG: hypothetical protein A3K18_01265 [Lentisphaerae bacterium RIFOXYA12_64_32]OGV86630.1 MAG: hypothetical protein A3K19_03485 [Lentisphaerae bacterium RIFOXYB12_FULL_65_16]
MDDTLQWPAAAELLRLLGHPLRLALLSELSRGPKCVTDIRELLEAPQANISQHLAVLRKARLVDCHEHGNLRCYYLLRPGLVRDLLRFLGRKYSPVPKTPAQVKRAAQARQRRTARAQCAVKTPAGR